MNLLRENDAPMTLSLALPPISILEFNGETSLWNWYIINHIRGEAKPSHRVAIEGQVPERKNTSIRHHRSQNY